jgi:hypothetical protein
MRLPVAHQQPAALDGRCACAERAQLGVHLTRLSRMNSTRRSARGNRSRIVAVEDEGTPHLARSAQGVVQRGMVLGAQVPAHPDQRPVELVPRVRVCRNTRGAARHGLE